MVAAVCVTFRRTHSVFDAYPVGDCLTHHLFAQISDGQRRRVQIFLQLLRPYKLVMLDEITTELDVITRADFLQHLKVGVVQLWPLAAASVPTRLPLMIWWSQEDSDKNGTTILYATHIFSGLDDWWTHVAFIADGTIKIYGRYGHCRCSPLTAVI